MLNASEKIIVNKISQEFQEKDFLDFSYIELYEHFGNKEIEKILSSYHGSFFKYFSYINRRISSGHIHAHESRQIRDLIDSLKRFLNNLETIKISLIEEYKEITKKLSLILQESGGTPIPEGFKELEIIEVKPIFFLNNTISKIETKKVLKLHPIGNGSYADVYKFKDEDYEETFTLKRLNKKALEKDFERLKREYETMKSLNSPFVAKVYRMNYEDKEYTMEYLDDTLYNYIQKKNASLNINSRYYIIGQILRGFEYLDRKKILHRDISPKNILLKFYEDDTIVVKISDFGLVKLENSTLTDPNSEFRGSLNDPKLKDIGFNKYDLTYEMYALTRLMAYILTGKSAFAKITDQDILAFLNKGISDKQEERYQNIYELGLEVRKLIGKLKTKEAR